METLGFDIAMQVLLFAVLIVAATTDVLYRKVFNWLTYPAIAFGLTLGYCVGHLQDHFAGFMLGAGIFGGDGFRLQHVSGVGIAWMELSGEVVQKDLRPGEVIRVHPGHVGAFESTVSFQITTVPGIRNMIFGGDGIFLAQLTGPGKIWLQTLPLSRLAHALVPYMPSATAERTEGGIVGGIIGSVLSGR